MTVVRVSDDSADLVAPHYNNNNLDGHNEDDEPDDVPALLREDQFDDEIDLVAFIPHPIRTGSGNTVGSRRNRTENHQQDSNKRRKIIVEDDDHDEEKAGSRVRVGSHSRTRVDYRSSRQVCFTPSPSHTARSSDNRCSYFSPPALRRRNGSSRRPHRHRSMTRPKLNSKNAMLRVKLLQAPNLEHDDDDVAVNESRARTNGSTLLDNDDDDDGLDRTNHDRTERNDDSDNDDDDSQDDSDEDDGEICSLEIYSGRGRRPYQQECHQSRYTSYVDDEPALVEDIL